MAERWLITGSDILDAAGNLLPARDILIADGRIAALSKAGTVPEPGEADYRAVDGRGCVLTPGLVNLHVHSPMNILRGFAEDVDVDTWFNRDIWPFESRLTTADIDAGALLAAAEMAACGVTAYADHYFSAESSCRAAAAAGLRLDIAPTLFGLAGDFGGQLKETERLFDHWNGHDGRIAVRLGPHSPYTCTHDQLKAAARLAGRLGTGAHIHISETREQVERSLKELGRTPFASLQEAGLFDLPLIIAHGVYLTGEDRGLLRRGLSAMALCPKTYLKLGTGFGNIFQRSGELPLAVGTDGAASSNTLDPLEQARLLALAGKLDAADGAAWDALSVWKILMRGHRALPFGTGPIEVGAPADLVLWNLRTPRTAPALNPLSAILYSAGPEEITYVWTAGKACKQDGQVTLDASGLADEVHARARALAGRGRGTTELSF